MSRMKLTLVVLMAWLAGWSISLANPQQVSDTAFKPAVKSPAFPEHKGPVVLLDEAHFNFHTADGRYQPFADLLRRDGYVVTPSRSKFQKSTLDQGKILVIANALAEQNQSDWSLPNPSAFTKAEIESVCSWVNNGGSLLLIADHMPFAGAATDLGAALGVRFSNGYALDQKAKGGTLVFRLADGTLKDHPILSGRSEHEKVDAVVTFTGSAFQIVGPAQPLLVFASTVNCLLPEKAWEFSEKTPRIPLEGWYQGAVFQFGKGKVAVFGEAAMFSAQLAGPNKNPMGMNAPLAAQNPQFLLNLVHWLSGLLPEAGKSEPKPSSHPKAHP
ncbi:MAG: DUF4350 domain-containing protein [Blastocatellia bacterium]|nr:DUF4350 domain-containing protein [Blastocatellia bacterium]